jgi:hypothetical protein
MAVCMWMKQTAHCLQVANLALQSQWLIKGLNSLTTERWLFLKIFIKRSIIRFPRTVKSKRVSKPHCEPRHPVCSLRNSFTGTGCSYLITLQKFSVGECWPSGYHLQINTFHAGPTNRISCWLAGQCAILQNEQPSLGGTPAPTNIGRTLYRLQRPLSCY